MARCRSLRHLLIPLLLLPAVASAGPEHLLDVVRLWRDVKYAHPLVADTTVNWDHALVQALPALLAARDDDALKQALHQLMRPLHDPALRIWDEIDYAPLESSNGLPLLEDAQRNLYILRLHAGRPVPEASWQAALRRLSAVRGLVVDLRAASWRAVDHSDRLEQLAAHIVTTPLLVPADQYRFHTGVPALGAPTPSEMSGGLLTLNTHWIPPAPLAQRTPIVFIVDSIFPVPKVAIALQRKGLAKIIAIEGVLRSVAVPLQHRNIGERVSVQFSRGRIVEPAGGIEYRPDQVIPAAHAAHDESMPVSAALRLLRHHRRWHPAKKGAPMPPAIFAQQEYDTPGLPTPEQRILSAIKLWATMDRQYPYRDLLGSTWDDALVTCLRRMQQVGSSLEYAQALEAMAMQLRDNHVGVWSRALNNVHGKANLPVLLAMVDGKVVVTANVIGKTQNESLAVGDEIVAVDGQPIEVHLTRLRSEQSAATEAGAELAALRALLRGEPGSIAQLKIDRLGGPQVVKLRREMIEDELVQRPSLPVMRHMTRDIAYVDLDRLQLEDVPAMFDFIAGSHGVVFDLPGYPHGTAWAIAARLNVKGAKFGPGIHQTFGGGMPTAAPMQLSYSQPLEAPRGPIYDGKIVILIDSRTMSQAEHTALMIESAAPVTYIGSPSVGTNGDLRHLLLPGKVTISFSGLKITRADGTQLQQVGIQPHIWAKPTLAGLRAERDEVLERALLYLQLEK